MYALISLNVRAIIEKYTDVFWLKFDLNYRGMYGQSPRSSHSDYRKMYGRFQELEHPKYH